MQQLFSEEPELVSEFQTFLPAAQLLISQAMQVTEVADGKEEQSERKSSKRPPPALEQCESGPVSNRRRVSADTVRISPTQDLYSDQMFPFPGFKVHCQAVLGIHWDLNMLEYRIPSEK